MMCTSLVNSTMENSTIEQELANFDIEARISVTVCFDEDSDETPIKTEPVTDDYEKPQQKPEIDNSAFVPILEPKKEVPDETSIPDITEELNQYIDNIVAHNNQIPQDKVTNKRKTDNVQDQSQTKRGRKSECDTGDQNNCQVNVNGGQNVSKNTSEIVASITITPIDPNSVLQTSDTTASSSDVNGLQQSDLNKINAHVTKSLAVVSENLRCIMKAYDYHKQHKTAPESFKDIKYNYFNLSYKTVVEILLPEENNVEFIQSFLNDTLQRARKVAGPYYIRTFRDFANLVYEMFMWAKQQQQISQAARNSKNMNNNSVINNLNTTSAEVDKVCIFSSGPPGRQLSINVDVTSKYFQKTAQKNSAEATLLQSSSETIENVPQISKNNTDQFKSTAESLAKFAAKYRNIDSKVTQNPIANLQAPSPSTEAYMQKPQQSPNTTADLTKNTLNNTQQPSLTSLLQRPPVTPLKGFAQPLQPQQGSQPPPTYEQFLNALHFKPQQTQFNPQQTQFNPQQTQFNPQQQISPQYKQAPWSQSQQINAQSVSVQQVQAAMVQAQQIPQYGVSLNYQMESNQQQMPQYKQKTKQPNVGLSQQYMQQPQLQQQLMQQQQQQRQRQTGCGGPMTSSIPTPLPSFNNLHVQSSNSVSWDHLHKSPSVIQTTSWKPPNSQPTQPQQIQPQTAKQTEWHRELNSIYQTGLAPQQAQKGSPRSASTDSGFISPLNFNVTTEQTVPTVPEESETIIPVITHVTSLNDKASFVESGTCAVCKKSSKQMCMGCMKIYYCTYECQSQDWTSHAQYCTQHLNGALLSYISSQN